MILGSSMDLEKSKIAVYAITKKGAKIGKKIKEEISCDLFLPERIAEMYSAKSFKRLSDLISDTFRKYDAHIFIMASGIVVRTIARHIGSKYEDPLVCIISQDGRYCISLLCGHRGANELARKISELIGAEPVITTGTEISGIPSIELIAEKEGMRIENREALKKVCLAIIEGEEIQVFDPEKRLPEEIPGKRINVEEEWKEEIPGIWVSWKHTKISEKKLILRPRCLIVGIGLNRGTDPEEVWSLIKEVFEENRLSLRSIKAIATVEEKKEERAVHEVAKKIDVPVFFLPSEKLKNIHVKTPSFFSKKYTGIESVCEASAIAAAKNGRLIVPKKKGKNVTVAVSLEY